MLGFHPWEHIPEDNLRRIGCFVHEIVSKAGKSTVFYKTHVQRLGNMKTMCPYVCVARLVCEEAVTRAQVKKKSDLQSEHSSWKVEYNRMHPG